MERFLFSKLEIWAVLLLVLFTGLVSGVWAYATVQYQVFPYSLVEEVRIFVAGHPADKRSFWQRLISEVSYSPGAFGVSLNKELVPSDKLLPITAGPKLDQEKINTKGIKYYSSINEERYFVVFGSFHFPVEKANWGAIAVDSKGVIHRAWAIKPDEQPYEYRGGGIGLTLTSDGDIVTNTAGVLNSYSWCGDKRWEAPWAKHPDGRFRDNDAADGYNWHHDVMYEGGRIYTFRGTSIATVDATSGEVLSEISAYDLIQWGWREGVNPFTARHRVEELAQLTMNNLSRESLAAIFHRDPFHFNKVDVLSEELAPLYPEFEAGDMLLSLRELNLVAIVRPSEERVIWWRYGLTARQHDSTFIEGHIEVFDNNSVSVPPQPRILRLHPIEQKAETIFDLSQWNLKMRNRGNFERSGDILLTTDTRGRAIAGRLDGSLDFVLENHWYDDAQEKWKTLQILNMTEVTPEKFQAFEGACQDGVVSAGTSLQ